MTGMTGSYQKDELQNINKAKAEIAGGFVLKYAQKFQCIYGISASVLNTVVTLSEEKVKQLVVVTTKLFVKTAHVIALIDVEQDASNNAGSELPPFLPKQLIHIDLRAFMNMVARQRPGLKRLLSNSEVQEIGVQCATLLRPYRENRSFRHVVNACFDFKSDFVAG